MTVTKSRPRLRHEGAEPMTLGSCSHQVTTQLPPSVLQSCPLVLSLLVFTVFFYFLIFYYNASLFEELNLVSVLSALFTFSYSLFTFFSASPSFVFSFSGFRGTNVFRSRQVHLMILMKGVMLRVLIRTSLGTLFGLICVWAFQ